MGGGEPGKLCTMVTSLRPPGPTLQPGSKQRKMCVSIILLVEVKGEGGRVKQEVRYLTTSMVSQGSLGGEGTLGCCLGLAGLGFWDCSGLNGLLT